MLNNIFTCGICEFNYLFNLYVYNTLSGRNNKQVFAIHLSLLFCVSHQKKKRPKDWRQTNCANHYILVLRELCFRIYIWDRNNAKATDELPQNILKRDRERTNWKPQLQITWLRFFNKNPIVLNCVHGNARCIQWWSNHSLINYTR